jgi:Concanavalin A-like lectin/glucanases superfamily
MARSFNGSTDFINVGSSATLNPAAITIGCWINPVQNTAFIVSRDDLTLGRSYALEMDNTSRVQIEINAGAVTVFGPSNVTFNAWQHVGFTGSSAAGYTAYLNGAPGTTGGAGTSMATATGPTDIGRRSFVGSPVSFDGNCADVGIWNVVLTTAEMLALAKGARPGQVRSASLIGWWPLDGLQSPEPDLSGKVFNGTLTGTASAFGPPLMRMSLRTPQFFLPAAVAATPLGGGTSINPSVRQGWRW